MNKPSIIKTTIKWNIHLIMFGVIFSLLYSVITTAMPLISKYLIDVVLTTSEKNQVYIGIAIFLGISLLQPVFYCCKEVVFTNLSEKISFQLRTKMYEKMIKLPIQTYDRISYGEISTKILSDTNEISRYINYGANNLFTNFILLILLTVFMFLQNALISGLIFVVFAIYFLLNKVISKKYKTLTTQILQVNEETNNIIKQNYDNIQVTKIFSNRENVNKNAEKIFSKNKKINIKGLNFGSILTGVTFGIMALILSIIYGLGALLIIKKQITLGTVIAIGLYFQSLVPSLNALLMNNINLNRVRPSINRLNDFMKEDEEIGRLENIGNAEIEFENVYFNYNDENTILNKINFKIDSAGVYAFVGDSGSGKSTIAKIILGLYLPEKGNVNIFQQNLFEINKEVLRKNISYVSQDAELINDTIYNNIILGNDKATYKEIENITKYFNIFDTINSLPNKFDTIVSEKINLSGGEKKRIAICRASLKSASIYIFDEPEASLPIEMFEKLSNLYAKLAEKNIVIVITHHKNSLPTCKKMFYLQEGELINE
ncbi:MAG TPA: ABC transporter ATP-binding protein [Candidatus Pelethenecus sp.]|nr:ABC transporter ATP-binding protein [Candidatus Pelethenecus sp.]